MAPKFDATAIAYVYVRQYGGETAAASVLAPKIGPLGMSPKKIGDDIVKNTQAWKGIRITVKLAIQNRQAKVSVEPNATSLLIKELKEPIRDRKKVKDIKHSGNLTKAQVLKVAKEMRYKSDARAMWGTVKEMLGTCFAIGCTVDGEDPTDIMAQIDDGTWEVPDEA